MKQPTDGDRRRPTLADRFIANNHPLMGRTVGEKNVLAIRARARQAHKFVFDDEASARVAQVVHDIPELILREFQFARAPYDLTWIEYQARPYWDILTDWAKSDGNSDERVGFLIDHNRVNVIAEGEDGVPEGGNGLYPISYHLNTEWPVEDQMRFAELAGTSRLGIDVWMWGSSAQKFIDAGEVDRLRVLRDHNMAEFICKPELLAKVRNVPEFLKGAQGDMRTIIAFLLMLNRPSVVQYRKTLPNWRGFVGNVVKPFFSHTTVTVAIDAVKTLTLIGTPKGESVARRRHEVRGHYCHDKTARDYMRIAGCIHNWAATRKDWTPWPDASADETNNWICRSCEGKRWWKAEHHRGTAEAGFMIHDGYEVIP